MNLEQIKKMGAFLGLESELRQQQRIQDAHIKDKKWVGARQATNNVAELLTAIIDLTNAAKQEEQPCVLTSQKTNLKPLSTP